MNRKLTTITLAIGFATLGGVTVIGTQALAQEATTSRTRGMMGPAMARGAQGRVAALIQELDLSEEQEARAKQLREELRESTRDTRPDRGEDMQTLARALEGEQPDSEAIHAMIDERMANRTQTAHATADSLLEFYSLLEPEQRAVVLERLDELEGRREQRRERLRERLEE